MEPLVHIANEYIGVVDLKVRQTVRYRLRGSCCSDLGLNSNTGDYDIITVYLSNGETITNATVTVASSWLETTYDGVQSTLISI